MRRSSLVLLFGFALAGCASAALAQTTPAPAGAPPAAAANSRKFDPYQSPLKTIMQTRLWADVPEAQGFVRETRPNPKDLKYTPLQSQLGPDPVRPKPRDAANIMALQAEMEASIAHNEARVGHSKPKVHRAKAAAATD